MSENVLIQSEVMRKNVGTIQEMQRQEPEHRTRQDRAAARLTKQTTKNLDHFPGASRRRSFSNKGSKSPRPACATT